MISQLFDAAAELAILLEQENAALRLHDFVATTRLTEPKRQAIAGFTAALSDHASHTDCGLATKSQATIRTRLDSALAENKRLLETAVKVQSEVIAIVLRSVEPPPSPRYRINGIQSSFNVAPVALAVRA